MLFPPLHALAGRQLELPRGVFRQKLQHVRAGANVGHFRVHVAQVDCVRGFGAIEACILDDGDAVIRRERIADCRPHATARRRAGDDEAVAAEKRQIGHERRAKKIF